MPMELTENQLNELIDEAARQAAEIVAHNTTLVLKGLAQQMADKPDRDEITLKVNVVYKHPTPDCWEIETAAEWERKVKEKDGIEPKSFNWNAPLLPGIVSALQNLASAIIEENEVKLDRLVDRCLCGHLRHDHRDNDGETGGCNQCVCEVFETEEDGPQPELPTIQNTPQNDEIEADYRPAVTGPVTEIVEFCACGHSDEHHTSLMNGACNLCNCKMMSETPAGEPTKADVKKVLLEMFADLPHLERNLAKIRAAGLGAWIVPRSLEKIMLFIHPEDSSWEVHRFKTKSACHQTAEEATNRGAIDLCMPQYKDRATQAGFYLLRLRTDGIFAKGKRGIGWTKESDARGEEGKAELIKMASQDPKALED
jgi:hypothetical protein